MTSIDITSTSRSSAICSDIVVRETESIRLVFRPEIVDNMHDPSACVRGTFLYQRKGRNEDWSAVPVTSLSSLKKGEGYQLELRSGELLPLLRQLSHLYRLAREQGVPQGRHRYVRMGEHLAQLLDLNEDELAAFLDANRAGAILTLQKVLRWLTNSSALAEFIEADGGQIAAINAALGVAALRTVLRLWDESGENPSEEFWQRALGDHSFVFSQLFAYPVILIHEKAYVGGKRLDNRHGNVADFLAKAERTGNALIIEIKTPKTGLLGAEYRDEAYPLSTELSGAIAQVLKYRDSLSENMRALSADSGSGFLVTEPRCLVIAGNCDSLDNEAKRLSFERYRERLMGVTIITFDELFDRVRQLERLLAPPAAS